jgi:hypothetical protein
VALHLSALVALALEALLSYGLTTGREGVSSHQPSGSPPALSVVDSPILPRDQLEPLGSFVRSSCGLGEAWRAALTGAHLARKSEITPSSPKVRRELFEIVLQEQILLAAR